MENRYYIKVMTKNNNRYREWYFLNWNSDTETFYLSHQAKSFVEDEKWDDGGYEKNGIGWVQIWTKDNYYYTALENVVLSNKEIKR